MTIQITGWAGSTILYCAQDMTRLGLITAFLLGLARFMKSINA